MGCPFCIRGGISSILFLPKRDLIVFHQSLLENFPDVIFSLKFVFIIMFCNPQSRYTFVSELSKFSQLFGVFTFLHVYGRVFFSLKFF